MLLDASPTRDLPSATVTFLLSDIEASTRLWEADRQAMGLASRRHDAIFEVAIAEHQGKLVRPRGEGDSRFAVFERASSALAAACDIQIALQAEMWPMGEPLRVRMGLHSGETELVDDDYYGTTVNRCARLRGLANGGQVLLSGLTANLVTGKLPPGVSLRSLGAHRLRDVAIPEQVFQLVHPLLPSDFPPLSSSLTNNIPTQISSFVGREDDLHNLEQCFDARRLVTITGVGGVGKTRLAVEFAARVGSAYPDGVRLVELAALSNPELVPNAVANVLGVREQGGRVILELLVEAVGQRSMLIVLDNCEHLVAAASQLTQALLAACADLRVLATSREPLRVSGEREFSLASLGRPLAGPVQQLDDLMKSDAVRLFCDRATEASATFKLDAVSAPGVVQICRRLEGLPLALELAARRVKILTPGQIAERLDDCFRVLVGGNRTDSARHQTLRATLDWSYALLSESEATLLRALSVYSGGWSLEAAAAIGVDAAFSSLDIEEVLVQLIDKSLVAVAHEPARAPRFRLLEPVRQYAMIRLQESSEHQKLRARHGLYMLRLAEAAEAQLRGPGQPEWLERLDEELDNLRSGLGWALETHQPDVGLRLATALERFWWVRRHLAEGEFWLDLDRWGSGVVADGTRAKALVAAGTLARASGDFARSAALCEEALVFFQRFDDPVGIADALNNLAVSAAQRGDYATSRRLLLDSLSVARRAGDLHSEARALFNLADNALDEHDEVQAIALLEQCLPLWRAVGDTWGIAGTLRDLGELAVVSGDFERAETLAAESAGLWERLGDRLAMSFAQVTLAKIALARGDRERAAELYRESLYLVTEAGAQSQIPPSLEHLAEVASAGGHPERGAILLGAADRLRTAGGVPLRPAEREDHARVLGGIREALAPAIFAGAWSDGHSRELADVVAYALDRSSEPGHPSLVAAAGTLR